MGDLRLASFEHSGGSVGNGPRHRRTQERLGLDHHNAQFSRLETALLLNRVEELQVVKMTIPEVPAEDDPCEDFALDPVILLDIVDRARLGLV